MYFRVAQGKLHSKFGNIRSLAATVCCGVCASFSYVLGSGMPGRQLMICEQTLRDWRRIDDSDSLLSQPGQQARQGRVVQGVVIVRKNGINFGGGKDSVENLQRIASNTYKSCFPLFLNLSQSRYGLIDYLIENSVLIVV